MKLVKKRQLQNEPIWGFPMVVTGSARVLFYNPARKFIAIAT
jgi:hypothetical protein